MTYVDSHSHLSSPAMAETILETVREARQLGIGVFVQGGIGPADWRRQIELKKRVSEIALCFGLHPYFVADNNEETCEQAMDELAKLLPQAVALGEAGLDYRPHIVKDSAERQLDFFVQQIELATVANKPMVLHIVRAHEEALRALDLWKTREAKGMVHSFNGSWKQAKQYLDLGLHLSVGCKTCFSDNHKLIDAIEQIPLGQLLLETDSPDQPPPGVAAGGNVPANLLKVAESVAQIKKLPVDEVLDRCSTNARKLFTL